MNQKTKTLLAGTLVVGCGAVWVPQFVGADSQPEHRIVDEIPASGSTNTVPKSDFVTNSGGGDSGREDEPVGFDTLFPSNGETSTSPSSLRDLERALEAAEDVASPDTELDLSALLLAMDPGRDDPTGKPIVEVPSSQTAESDQLASFAESNPLTATIAGENPIALLGHRVVREGDLVGGGTIRIDAIGAGFLMLSAGKEQARMELPAFQARFTPALSTESDAGSETLDGGPAAEPGSGAGQSAEVGLNELVGGQE